MPLIVQSTKKHHPSFNLSIIKSHMQMATKRTTTLEETKVAIVNMYQNGTIKNLSSQAQKAAHALAQYIHKHKAKQTFAFTLGKDYQDQQLLLLTIANHPAKPKGNASLQRAIRQVTTSPQQSQDLSLVNQLPWVTSALQQAEFGILFWIYQHRLSSQESLPGIKQVPAPIIAVNFQRVKTPHEQLQAQAWAKMMQVVQNLTSSQLKISPDAQQLPSQTKITTRDIVLAIQKIIIANDAISKAAQKLMKEDNIEVQLVDKTGVMMITIKNYGHDKIITIFGFKATGTPLEVAQAKIKAAKDGASLPTKLNQVLHGQMPIASNVNAPMKDGVIFKFQSATAINNKGASTLTYEVDVDPQVEGANSQEVTFVVSGFETQAQAVERIAILAQVAIQNLVASNFTTGINKAQIALASKLSKVDVISDIKKQIDNSDAQALILPGDITITPDNTAQTITIVIHNHGPSKTITILGFISIKDYLDQLLNATPSLGGVLEIPEAITSRQFNEYVQAMGNVFNAKDELVMNKFAEKYRTKITSLIIPNSFTTIGPWFRHFNKITSLSIPNSVTKIGVSAFESALLTSLRIPNIVTTIGENAFATSPLTTLTLGEALQTIGDLAFQGAWLKSLHIPNSVTTIGNYAFQLSPLTTLSLGDHLQTIGQSAFYNAQLSSLHIPNSVIAIGSGAFHRAPLTTLSLGNHLQTIGDGAFQSAQLKSLHIPDSVTTIGQWAFLNSPLGNVKVFEGVKLHENAFKDGIVIKWIKRPS